MRNQKTKTNQSALKTIFFTISLLTISIAQAKVIEITPPKFLIKPKKQEPPREVDIELTRLLEAEVEEAMGVDLARKHRFTIKKPLPTYNLNISCNNIEVWAVNFADIKFKLTEPATVSNKEKLEFSSGYWVGSGGSKMWILLIDKRNHTITKVYDDTVIDIQGTQKLSNQQTNCPNIIVTLHGIYYDRTGNQYGSSQLKWTGQKYQIEKSQN